MTHISDDDRRTYADLHAVRVTSGGAYTRDLGGGVTANVSRTGEVTLSTGMSTVTVFAEHAAIVAGLFTGIAMTQQPDLDWTTETARIIAVTRACLDGTRRG